MAANEYRQFYSWWNCADGANGGAAWFYTRVRRDDTAGDLEVVLARFTGPYTATALPGARWSINATWEVKDAG